MPRLSDCRNPGSLSCTERQALAAAAGPEQAGWLRRLNELVEPPAPTEGFPAFLLETPAYASLREAVGDARHRRELDTATADELQHFVDRYRSWLLQTDEELARQQEDMDLTAR